MDKPLKLTAAEIDAGRTARGGWTYQQLRKWGVPIPPPSGWRQALLRGAPIPQQPSDRRPSRQEFAFRAGFEAGTEDPGVRDVERAWNEYRSMIDDINAERAARETPE